jgi:hypothetical protein
MKSNKLLKKFNNILTQPKIVKVSTIIALLTTVSCIILGYIVAQFDPQGYNMFQNYLSDMGSIDHTPFPYFPIIKNVISSIFLIPTLLYMENLLAPLPYNVEELQNFSRTRIRLGSFGFFWMFLGLVGMFGLGVFTEDISMSIHIFCTFLEFVGLTFGGIFFGLIIIFYPTMFPKLLGIYMTFVPTFLCIILFSVSFQPIFEWILTFSILAYMILGGLIVLKHINKKITN